MGNTLMFKYSGPPVLGMLTQPITSFLETLPILKVLNPNSLSPLIMGPQRNRSRVISELQLCQSSRKALEVM